MHRGLVVADDLTGAADTGHAFASRGFETVVSLDDGSSTSSSICTADSPRSVEVLVYNTDSRYALPESAADAVRAAIESSPAPLVYVKIDSTLRGNVRQSVEAALAATGTRLAIVAPAYPATGRTTERGHHLVDGQPVSETAFGQGPNAPETEDLRELLGTDDRSVAFLDIETISRGVETVAERLQSIGRESISVDSVESEGDDDGVIVVCDAIEEHHLATIGAAGTLIEDGIFVGSAGLAEHLDLPYRLSDEDDRPDHRPVQEHPSDRPDGPGGVLGVVGSVTSDTLAALATIPDRSMVVLDGARIVENPADEIERSTAVARETIERDDRVILTAATEQSAVDRSLSAGSTMGLSTVETRERVEDGLAAVASGVVRTHAPGGLFLTGGETAGRVLSTLSVSSLRLTGQAVAHGVPVARIDGGCLDGCGVITRAGGFGGPETVVNCLDFLGTAYD